MNGNWIIRLSGNGKIHPADADEIQEMLASFISELTAAGHTNISGMIEKSMG